MRSEDQLPVALCKIISNRRCLKKSIGKWGCAKSIKDTLVWIRTPSILLVMRVVVD